MPEVLNILDFDVSEVCKAYALRYVNPSTPDESDDYYDYRFAKKVVFSANVENGEYTVMVIDLNKRLWHINSGCENWTPMMGKDYIYLNLFYDVAIVKGQVHVIDGGGCVWALNSKFGWRRAGGKRTKALKMRLVELCNGELVLVEEMGAADGIWSRRCYASEMVVDVKIHALSEQGNGLVDANAMNGSIIVVGDDCSFSVPTSQELKGARVFYTDRYCFLREHDEIPDYLCYECDCRGSCSCVNGLETIAADELVANDDFKGFYGHNIGVCDFETGGTGTTLMFPEYASIFWPPPAWLSRS